MVKHGDIIFSESLGIRATYCWPTAGQLMACLKSSTQPLVPKDFSPRRIVLPTFLADYAQQGNVGRT